MAGNVILVLGGARSGKSRFAQCYAESHFSRPLYLATAEGLDAEMRSRIQMHRKARGRHWRCVEEPLALERVLLHPPACDGILIDCLTLWVSNVLCRKGEKAFPPARKRLLAALKHCRKDVILVSNEVGMGLVPDTELGRKFRDLAGWLNQDVAEAADVVVLVTAGLPQVLKGKFLPCFARTPRGFRLCSEASFDALRAMADRTQGPELHRKVGKYGKD